MADSGWISIEDRLPPRKELVEVKCEPDPAHEWFFWSEVEVAYYRDEEMAGRPLFSLEREPHIWPPVTHWRPLKVDDNGR